jgi:putative sigma-54 modulation protein
MNIEFTGRHVEFTPALKAHATEHLERIEHLFDGRPPKIHVVIEVERGMHRSEVILNWRNENLTATTSIPDMYQSLSQTIDKIEKQARRLKDKVIDKAHRATSVAVIAATDDTEETVV